MIYKQHGKLTQKVHDQNNLLSFLYDHYHLEYDEEIDNDN
jgi:hypothetical protein